MNTDPIEAEISQLPAVVSKVEAVPALFGTTEPAEIIRKATDIAVQLRCVIQRQGLISKISGKEYPLCEAWTLLGTLLGVFPVTQWTRRLDNGWEARVEVHTLSGAVIGSAEAMCTRDERNWSNRDDFALRSMAQTRATAKALRMPLGFVMSLSGYQATPAEEIAQDAAGRADKAKPPSKATNFGKVATGGAKQAQKASKAQLASLTAWLEKCKVKLLADMRQCPEHIVFAFVRQKGWLLDTEDGAEALGIELPRLFPSVNWDGTIASNTEAVKADAQAILTELKAFAGAGAHTTDPPASPAIGGNPAPASNVSNPEEFEGIELAGYIKRVNAKTTKTGKEKYGILVVQDMQDREGGDWINSFSSTDFEKAQELEGKMVSLFYTEGQWGKDLTPHSIEEITCN